MSASITQINPATGLTWRWTPLRAHATQSRYWNSTHRFNVIPAGRRSGKTELFKRKVVKKALGAKTPWAPAYFAAAPTRDQAKRIYWDDLKALSDRRFVRDISESDLMIQYINGAEIWVIGMDKPERIEGKPWDGGGLDEYANMKAKAWGANVRPALSDREGWCDFLGVPEGRNHYYELNNKAKAAMRDAGNDSEWGSFSWPSSDILSAEEIEAARNDLDPLTFAQEYEASFVNFTGRAYYQFIEDTHCAPLAQYYNPKAPLILMFDFNVEPGVCAIAQEMLLPGVFEVTKTGSGVIARQQVTGTAIIGEVHIPRNSNTPAVCRAILKNKDGTDSMWSKHEGLVRCYGDATGGARGTAKVEGSDWDLIDKELRPAFKTRLSFRVEDANPKERARLNAMNSRLRSTSGVIRLLVDAKAAPNVVKDLEGVTLLEGGSGEIDKEKSPELTHVSDAIGYYVSKEFPVVSQTAVRTMLGGV